MPTCGCLLVCLFRFLFQLTRRLACVLGLHKTTMCSEVYARLHFIWNMVLLLGHSRENLNTTTFQLNHKQALKNIC